MCCGACVRSRPGSEALAEVLLVGTGRKAIRKEGDNYA